jgi:hypothetical protein
VSTPSQAPGAHRCWGFKTASYLTHHRSIPMGDLDATLMNLPDRSSIYWLSWYEVAEWSASKLTECSLPVTVFRIFAVLSDYLSSKGYRRFRQWQAVRHNIKVGSVYTRIYVVAQGMPVPKHTSLYLRLYLQPTTVLSIPTFYNRNGATP